MISQKIHADLLAVRAKLNQLSSSPNRRTNWPVDIKSEILALVSSGVPQREIRRYLGVTAKQVNSWRQESLASVGLAKVSAAPRILTVERDAEAVADLSKRIRVTAETGKIIIEISL